MTARLQGPRCTAGGLDRSVSVGARRLAMASLGCAAFLLAWLVALGGLARAALVSGYSVQSTQVAVAPGPTPTDVAASCPTGATVTGGGFHVEDPVLVVVSASEPAAVGGGWHAVVRNAGSSAERVTVTAVCIAAPLATYAQVSSSASVPAGASGAANATCPGTSTVVGGGFRLADPSNFKLFHSLPQGVNSTLSSTQWDVLVANTGATAFDVTATAVCVGGLDGYEQPSSSPTVVAGTTVTVTAACGGAGAKVLGGGFRVETPDDLKLFSSAPTDAAGNLSDHRWSSQVRNAGTLDRGTTVTAICAAAAASAPPTVTAISPVSGPEAGGTPVTITGADFLGASGVSFGAAPASYTVDSSTQITAFSPAGAGMVDVTVTTPAGTSPATPADRFTYPPQASVATHVTPSGSIALGATFNDAATVSTDGPAPATGTVTFDVFGPSTSECGGAPTFTDTQPLAAGTATSPGTATSRDFTGTDAGLYQVIARYSGDQNYPPARSGCFDASESIRVAQASPALTTQVSKAQITQGNSFTDTATLAPGSPAATRPTGKVTFDVYGPNDNTSCDATPALSSTVTLDPSGTATSDPLVPATPGSYTIVASYGGDRNYARAANACYDETVIVANPAPAISTQVSPVTIYVGQSFSDAATLSTPTGTPGGTVTFDVYGPGDPTCSNPARLTDSRNLDGPRVTSKRFIPTVPGTYQVIASYSGDTSFSPSTTACGDPGETVNVQQAAAVITTAASPPGFALGGSFQDTATLTLPAGAPPPGGNVKFDVYGPADPGCAAPVPLFTSTSPVGPVAAGAAQAVSGPFTPAATGTYRVIATYTGDVNYASASTRCRDAPETVTVTAATPGIATAVSPPQITLGGAFHDTATLTSPAGAAAPTGSVEFDVYGPGDTMCSAATPLLTRTGSVATSGGVTTAASGDFTPVGPGTYRVIARYPGDANYAPSSTACADPNEAVTVSRATPGIATAVTPTSIPQGASFQDTASLTPVAGAAAPAGTVTFDVYGPADPTCAAAPVLRSTNPVTTAAGASSAASDPFTPAAAGTYRVVAAYAGDPSYSPASSSCADPAEAVVVLPPPPTVSAVSPRSGPPAGGNQVRITGRDFTGAPAVWFGAAPATAVGVDPAGTQITATAPAGSGTVDVTVVNAGGASATGPADRYTYFNPVPPAVSSLTPASGSTAGGTPVVIFGSNLGGATAVRFGTTPAPVLNVSDDATRLATIAPAGAGAVDVTVTTPFGTSPAAEPDRFTYVVPPPAPTVTGLSPASGPPDGATVVTIAGTGFTGATAVRFGGAAAGGYRIDSPSQITATAPAGAVGTVEVTVTGPGGTSPTGAGDQYTYVAAPAGATTGSTTGALPPPPGQPSAHTGPPKVITSSSAEFTATINPQGLGTTMHFEYQGEGAAAGASAAAITYDARTPEQAVGADFSDHTVTARVADLVPNRVYHVRAVAANASGVTPSGDATFRTATDPPPPPPVLGRTFNAEPLSGNVFVLLPGAGHVSQAHASIAKGVGFIPLTEARQLPVGTIFDTTAGVARLTNATATPGRTQSGDFGAGLFRLRQNRRDQGVTELALIVQSSKRRQCAATGRTASAAARRALPKTVLTLLRATAKGRYRTRGRFSSATVRGTIWTTSDRCDGTLTRVKRGVVVVSDLRRRRQIVLRAGGSYLAKAP